MLAGTAALASVLVGEVYARPGTTISPRTAQIALDVIASVQSGQARVRTPTGAAFAFLPPFLDRQFKWVRGDERRWLYMHPPSELELRLRVPADAYFQSALALDPATWHEPIGDGARFIVEAQTSTERLTLLDRHLRPRHSGEEQAWNEIWLPLDRLVGQEITLRLRTEHGADPAFDWAGWSNPQVVTYRTSRPNPGEIHKW